MDSCFFLSFLPFLPCGWKQRTLEGDGTFFIWEQDVQEPAASSNLDAQIQEARKGGGCFPENWDGPGWMSPQAEINKVNWSKLQNARRLDYNLKLQGD